jgi:hypothetical protein
MQGEKKNREEMEKMEVKGRKKWRKHETKSIIIIITGKTIAFLRKFCQI